MNQLKHFSSEEELKIKKLLKENAFATVLSYPNNSKPFINHLPIMFSTTPGGESTIIGHMSKRNPQWEHFIKNPDSTIVINGAHTYVTPAWYKLNQDVPTWNYAVAHLNGKMELVGLFCGRFSLQMLRAFLHMQRISTLVNILFGRHINPFKTV